jgi:hypothetical protein
VISAASAGDSSGTMKAGAEAGAITATLSENMRLMSIAGLAKLVELVSKDAAPMQGPTAAWRPDRGGAAQDGRQA